MTSEEFIAAIYVISVVIALFMSGVAYLCAIHWSISQERIDQNNLGWAKIYKAFLIIFFMISSLVIALGFFLPMVFSGHLVPLLAGTSYIVVLISLVKPFVAAWRSERPFYQLIDEMREKSRKVEMLLSFIAYSPCILFPISMSLIS